MIMRSFNIIVSFAVIVALSAIGLVALVRDAFGEHASSTKEEAIARMDTREVKPSDAFPIVQGGQWRVNCASMDGGSPTDCLVPMDGGTAGNPVRVSSLYIAPCVSGSTGCTGTNKIRVGFRELAGTLTQSTGFEVGASGRDGAGLSENATTCRCISEGAAQQADVVAGRTQ